MTYKEVLTKAASQPNVNPPTPQALAHTLDARVRAREGIKSRQILIDAPNIGEVLLEGLSNTAIVQRTNEIIQSMPDCSKHTVNSARQLNNGGILLELDTEEATRWINSAINHLTFLTKLAPEARIKTRAYPIVIQFIPLGGCSD